jgi:hypothetical protein
MVRQTQVQKPWTQISSLNRFELKIEVGEFTSISK